jgi:hypothetical protein
MQVIGHRGTAAQAPENTYPSFDLALAVFYSVTVSAFISFSKASAPRMR